MPTITSRPPVRLTTATLDPAPLGIDARAPSAEPADLQSLVGTLDYYAARRRDFEERHPGKQAPDYYMGYGDKYLRRFLVDNLPLMSPKGQEWSRAVARGLQQRIEDLRRDDPAAFDKLEQDAVRFKDFAYKTHSEAYLEPGLDKLPLSDLILIGTMPDPNDVYSRKGILQILETKHGLKVRYAANLMEMAREWMGSDPEKIREMKREVWAAKVTEWERMTTVVARRKGQYLKRLFDWLFGRR